jgi:catechol 2,3-dioxygenase-like lactoylglutathione lyase family enzyme
MNDPRRPQADHGRHRSQRPVADTDRQKATRPNLDNLRKRAKTLVRQHREGFYPLAAKLRLAVPRFAKLSDREILDAPFTLADAQRLVAREAGYADWALAAKELGKMSIATTPAASVPETARLCIAYPQLFVADVPRAAKFYEKTLGFSIAYLYGEPPFYALVTRDGIGLNLRCVVPPPVDSALREKKSLLGASIITNGVKALFLEFKERGADLAQTLTEQPWGATDFIVRDPDGNLLCFASPASENDRRWSAAPPG